MSAGTDPAVLIAQERLRVLEQVDDLTTELNEIVRFVEAESPDDEHDPEGATSGYERQRVAALLDHVRGRLAELDEAIARIEAGTYGQCVDCGRPIARERLEALPTTTTCVDCAT